VPKKKALEKILLELKDDNIEELVKKNMELDNDFISITGNLVTSKGYEYEKNK